MSDFSSNTDCLVLKIQDYDKPSNILDNTMYILYDCRSEMFVIRGCRRSLPKRQSQTYSFHCRKSNRLIDFILYTIGVEQKTSETLFNIKTLPDNIDDITFELLKASQKSSHEIVGYSDSELSRTRLKKMLNILKNVFNSY